MAHILKAGFLYFLGVFAMGFILGALRRFVLAAFLGPVTAVLIEMPLMLVFAWHLCRVLISRFAVEAEIAARLTMGLVAFACLMTGELLIAVQLQAGGVADFFQLFHLPENRIGLGGQIAFALFPVIQRYGRVTADR